jgi:hypothetical protein
MFTLRHSRFPRRGQVAVFLLMLLTALAFVLLWNVDLHRLITTKTRSQNAGDAAALAGARWQGISLNLVGELNLLHALALSVPGNAAAVEASTNIQARVLFTGPLLGLAAAQVAAKNNGMYADDGFRQHVLDLADEVAGYGSSVGGAPAIPPPYDGAWPEYEAMLRAIAGDGIAADPGRFFFNWNLTGDQILLDPSFYDAVAGKTWCWFFLRHPRLLQDYTDHTYWGQVATGTQTVYDCGFLPLWVRPVTVPLGRLISASNLLAEAGREQVDMTGFDPASTGRVDETWYEYDPAWWGPWSLMSLSGDHPFPATGPVKPE